jgi:glutamine amidotransferase
MHVAIIDYGSGNLHSAAKAFERAAREQGSPLGVRVTADPEEVRAAERIVLPGVGAFADCRNGLVGIPGMSEALEESVRKRGKPFLGICVGLQLMAERGLEHGLTPGLGWIEGEVRTIEPRDPSLKIPHMGWNELKIERAHPLLANMPPNGHAYFVHSYHFRAKNKSTVLATTDYGETLTAMIGRDNIAGTHFHPEKSQAVGLTLLGNFLRWKP